MRRINDAENSNAFYIYSNRNVIFKLQKYFTTLLFLLYFGSNTVNAAFVSRRDLF